MTIKQHIQPRKQVALVAHDNKKQDLIEWARYNAKLLSKHDLYATGTTGALLEEPITRV
jgi:methylglyoxal synthase